MGDRLGMRVEIIAFLLSNFGGGADTNACARRATEVLLRSSFILSESLINILPRKIGKIGKIGDLRRSFSSLTARSFFLSDLSRVLSGESSDSPRQTIDASLHPLDLARLGHPEE
jgi:hypothetical protein